GGMVDFVSSVVKGGISLLSVRKGKTSALDVESWGIGPMLAQRKWFVLIAEKKDTRVRSARNQRQPLEKYLL
ncbi:hypothetical protein A2U01_0098858, partial [Trifolium medium]|nr:hypothetical protein [Trifolium medium]